jgi:hypothetical protein
MGLPSSIAKGLAHVGSESGALVCVKVSGSPHHLDLVRAPGMLTPLRAGLPTIPPGGCAVGLQLDGAVCVRPPPAVREARDQAVHHSLQQMCRAALSAGGGTCGMHSSIAVAMSSRRHCCKC